MNPLTQAFARHGIARCAIMATTFRSGSTWIGRLIDKHGLAGMKGERLRRIDAADDLDAALDAVIAAEPGPVFATRLMGPQRARLAEAVGLGDVPAGFAGAFPDCRWLWLRRRDVVGQGISYWRARSTGRWHVNKDDPAPEPAIAYDFAAIDGAIADLARHDAGWARFFEAAGIAPTELWYEDFMADPRVIGAYLAPFGIMLRGTRSQLRIQADDHTEHCRARYLQDREGRNSATIMPMGTCA